MSQQPTAAASASTFQQIRKAVWGFLAPLVATLAGLYLTQGHLTLKEALVALASAIVTGGGVYKVRNGLSPAQLSEAHLTLLQQGVVAPQPTLPRVVTAPVDSPAAVAQVLTPKQGGE